MRRVAFAKASARNPHLLIARGTYEEHAGRAELRRCRSRLA